jgi:hypothetical protein
VSLRAARVELIEWLADWLRGSMPWRVTICAACSLRHHPPPCPARCCLQGHGGFMLPGLIATWGTALLASMAGLAAPEAAGLAEQAAQAAMTE